MDGVPGLLFRQADVDHFRREFFGRSFGDIHEERNAEPEAVQRNRFGVRSGGDPGSDFFMTGGFHGYDVVFASVQGNSRRSDKGFSRKGVNGYSGVTGVAVDFYILRRTVEGPCATLGDL